MVNSNGADISSTDSSESHKSMLPFTDVYNPFIQVQKIGDVS